VTEFRLEEPDPPPAAPTAPPAPPPVVRARARGAAASPRRGRRVLVLFLLANLVPVAAAIWIATLTPDERRRLVESIPAGVGGRALVAGIAFATLVVLARLVLPASRGSLELLARALAWFRRRPAGQRALLYPLEALTHLLWFVVQVLFALDAVAILGTGILFLMYVARILKPELFPFLPPKE
jgi:hypothetical protein